MSSAVKGVIGLVATVAIAAVVAYGVSAPRNVDAVMNQDMAALGGRSMNDHMAEAYTKAADERCAKFTEMAEQAWDRAIEQGTDERDADTLDELDRQVDQHCNR
ncbi:MAG: hypothetical protein WBH10_09180 [Allopontixanthobacter sediminis]